MSSSRRGRNHRARAVAVRALLVILGMAAAVVLVEGALRLSGTGRGFARPDAAIGYVLTPSFTRTLPLFEHAGGKVVLRTNNLGLRRDSDTPLAKPAGDTRVLVLGDSQSEGIVSNAEAYPTLLEAALAGDGIGTVEVLNAAVSGYSPLLEYLALTMQRAVLQPDLIVLALYTGNDVAELQMHQEDFGGFGPRFSLPFLEPADGSWRVSLPGSEQGWLGRADWLLGCDLRGYWLLRKRLRSTGGGADAALARVAAQCPGCLQALWQPYVAHGELAGLAEPFDKLGFLVEQFSAASARLGAALLVVVIPTRLEVESGRAAAAVTAATRILGLQGDPAAFDTAVRQRMIDLAERRGVRVLDLLPALRRGAANAGGLYWALDWHLDVEGHRVVAEAVHPVVAEILRSRRGQHGG